MTTHRTQRSGIQAIGLMLGLACMLPAGAALGESSLDMVNQGKLTIGADLTYPPYNYLEGDRAAGFDPEFMRIVAAKMELEPKYVDTRFAQLITGLRSHRFDVVASILYITPERAKVIDYVPYIQTGNSLIVLKDSEFTPKSPHDLCGKRVGSIKGASWIPKLEKVTEEYCLPNDKGAIDNREFSTAPGATQALLSRAIDVQFADAAVSKRAVEKSNDRLRITTDKLLFPIAVGLGVTKGNDELKAALEKAIAEMKESGEYQRLLDKYNLAPPSQEQVEKALSAE